MRTIRGIYYNLDETTYIYKYKDLELYFSSNFYKERYDDILNDYIKNETVKLESKYKCKLNIEYMLALNLYKQIEKRGFKAKFKEKEINENYLFNAIMKL